MGTQLDLVQFETQVLFPIIQTSTIISLLKTGRVSCVPSYSSLYVLSPMNSNYMESIISLLGETVCLCLGTTSKYVLETISRVGAIVELSLLAPHLRNPFSADRCSM